MIVLALLVCVGGWQLHRSMAIAREELALVMLHTIARGCQFYMVVNGRYPHELTELSPDGPHPPYLLGAFVIADPTMTKHGYRFTYSRSDDGTNFLLTATPVYRGGAGGASFSVDQTGIIRSAHDARTTETRLRAVYANPEV